MPRELSRYFYYAMQSGARFTARVYSARHRPSPLLQGGLEILLVVDVEREETSKLDIFRECVDKVGYNVVLFSVFLLINTSLFSFFSFSFSHLFLRDMVLKLGKLPVAKQDIKK